MTFRRTLAHAVSGLFALSALFGLACPALSSPVQGVRTEPSDDAHGPLIFSGVLKNRAIRKNILARLVLVRTSQAEISRDTDFVGKAVLSLHMDNFGSVEYIPLAYPVARYTARTGQLALSGPNLPALYFTRRENGIMSSSLLDRLTQEIVGEVLFARGLTMPEGSFDQPVMTSVSGSYEVDPEADCSALTASSTVLTGLELVASRLPKLSSIQPPEATLGALNYVGAALCHYTGTITCDSFQSGVLDLYRDNLELFRIGGFNWKCDRKGADGLLCTSPRYGLCPLTRKGASPGDGGMPDRGASFPKNSPVDLRRLGESNRSSTPPDSGISAGVPTTLPPARGSPAEGWGEDHGGRFCGEWRGLRQGLLRHATTGKVQWLNLRLRAFFQASAEAPPRCGLVGEFQQIFGPKVDGLDRHTYVIPLTVFDPGQTSVILASEDGGSVTLEVSLENQNELRGNLYADNFGFVGSFHAAKRSFAGVDLGENYVPSIAGAYLMKPTEAFPLARAFTLDTTPLLSAIGTRGNPNWQTLTTGAFYQVMHGSQLLNDVVAASTYDFYVNSLVLAGGGAYYAGLVDEKSFTTRIINVGFLNHAFEPGTIRRYDRIVEGPRTLAVRRKRPAPPPVVDLPQPAPLLPRHFGRRTSEPAFGAGFVINQRIWDPVTQTFGPQVTNPWAPLPPPQQRPPLR